MQDKNDSGEWWRPRVTWERRAKCSHPVDGRMPLSGGDWMCTECGEYVMSPREQADLDAAMRAACAPLESSGPHWFSTMETLAMRWITAHPGEPYPVPAWAQEIAAAHPASAARALLLTLCALGVETTEGDFPIGAR